jgi:hypothetical protein
MCTLGLVTPHTRILAFSGAGALVLAGAVCAALVSGITGEVLTIVLMSTGFGGALLLVFLEIGLGEERELDREQKLREERERRRLTAWRRGPWLTRRPRRPS